MTDHMFQIDQAANDRLVLDEEQRRNDLIEQAVQRFAPALAGKSGVKVIHLYSTNATLRKAIREMAGGRTIVVEHVLTAGKSPAQVVQDGMFLKIPDRADLVATKSDLNKKTEWLAARLAAQCIVLPEANEYLLKRLDRQLVITIVGADQA